MRNTLRGLSYVVGFWLLGAAILMTRGVVLIVLAAIFISVVLFMLGQDNR